jgi:predicted alpha/beta superfamily hydrolase
MFVRTVGLSLVLALAGGAACATSPDRDVVAFSITWDVGFGNDVYVVGSHPDVGNWTPTGAVRLRWTSGNVWTGNIAIQRGTVLEYKFISRNGATNQYCNNANVIWEPGPNRTNIITAASPSPVTGKTIYYYSSWPTASIVFTSGPDTNFYTQALTPIGPGRATGEFLHRADGVGVAGASIQFVMTDGNGNYDRAPYTNGVGFLGRDYLTSLDVFLLQDGDIFNYWPSNTVSAPRIETRYVDSSFPPISGRTVRIILPRGYDSHPWKRYPVMYFQDGQNITNGANPGGSGAWDVDLISRLETSQGRVREAIYVGVDNYPDRRRWEYNPLGDTYPGELPGRADAYVNFLVHNVRPTIDFHYRTLNDRRNTLIGGSSMGGLCSLYAGFETNVFGGVLAMSPAVTRATNYKAALAFKPKQPMRIYMDTGTNEGQVGPLPGGNYWEEPWHAYGSLLRVGYVPNLDLMMRIGCGHAHNEAAWRARLPTALRFLLPVADAPNLLAHVAHPPIIRSFDRAGGDVIVMHDARAHQRYELDAAPDPNGPWTTIATTAPMSFAWSYPSATGSISDAAATLRIRAIPSP